MDIFKKIGANLKKNTKAPIMKKIAWGLIGGALYPLIPTAIQGISKGKVDMTGWKGVITGGLSTALIGMGADKPEIAAGGLASMMTHILYVKANDQVASLLGTPIFKFDANSQLLGDDAIPPGMQLVSMPDGTKVLAKVDGVSDYVNELPGKTGMSDFTNDIPVSANRQQKQQTLNDFVDSIAMSGGDYALNKWINAFASGKAA